MMKTLINKIITLFLLIISTGLFSQGLVENPLTTNSVLVTKWNEYQTKSIERSGSIYDTLNLGVKGILDDFSKEGPYPDTAIWLDNFVFINRDYPKAPITLGVATFDGLSYNGYPYNFLATPTSSAIADYLTSKPINLNYPASDSIYLSFYYQPQGIGNDPEDVDSLVLEFKNPSLSINSWKHIWSTEGSNLFDSSWNLVMIPIKDPAFLKKGFQFRFKNYATLSGNLDHWSIDYVYLNRIRNQNDTVFEDISFVYNTPSLLNTYTAMPWNHYRTSDMKTAYSTSIRNNNLAVKNGSFTYSIFDDSGTLVNTYPGGNNNIDPYATSGYVNYPAFSAPPLSYTIPLLTEPTDYTIVSAINSTPDFDRNNDTVKHVQTFFNYYAYDDGTAEYAFGLPTLYGEMAERFVSTTTDTLQCIDIYFNPVLTDATLYKFKLKVWNDIGGVPGSLLYTSGTTLSPVYDSAKMGPNHFIRYTLDAPINMVAGTFYIGFVQNTNQFLNVGVDKNNNTQNNILYNVAGAWNTSPFSGSLMMHPVFGESKYLVGVESHTVRNKNLFSVYPNPANDKLYIKTTLINSSEKISYTIIDMLGRKVLENSLEESKFVDISTLLEGVYFIRINDGGVSSTNKFIKVK